MCAVVGSFATAGCGGTGDSPDEVVAAFYPLSYAAEQVGARDVVDLTPPGAEPHDFELTPQDVLRVREAKLVVYLGDGFQPSVESAVDGRDGPSLDALERVELLPAVAGRAGADPHVWLDPLRYAAIARAIANAIGGGASADGLVARLRALDREYRRGLADCRRRELVTSHAAFGYLAARYGLRQVALLGIAPEGEPNPRQVARLVREVRDSGATTVYFERLLSPTLAETVAREAGAATAVLDPLEGLTAADADAGADYFSVMRANLAALRKGLACT